jgi:hypothetical protein
MANSLSSGRYFTLLTKGLLLDAKWGSLFKANWQTDFTYLKVQGTCPASLMAPRATSSPGSCAPPWNNGSERRSEHRTTYLRQTSLDFLPFSIELPPTLTLKPTHEHRRETRSGELETVRHCPHDGLGRQSQENNALAGSVCASRAARERLFDAVR